MAARTRVLHQASICAPTGLYVTQSKRVGVVLRDQRLEPRRCQAGRTAFRALATSSFTEQKRFTPFCLSSVSPPQQHHLHGSRCSSYGVEAWKTGEIPFVPVHASGA